MKKIVLLMALLLSLGCTKAAKSLEIVHDLIAFDEMVMQTYALNKSIENQIKEIGYIYEFLQYQIRSIEKLKPDSYLSIRNFIVARGNGLSALQNRIENLNLEIGGKAYSLREALPANDELAGLFTTLVKAKADNNTQLYTRTLDNINAKDETIRQYLTGIIREAVAIGIESDDYINESNTRLGKLVDEISGNDSITSQLQVCNKLALETNLSLHEVIKALNQANKMYAARSLAGMFSEYKQGTQQNRDFGTAGIDDSPTAGFGEYLDNRAIHVTDPVELFDTNRR